MGILKGVVLKLRNHFWGSKETPPPPHPTMYYYNYFGKYFEVGFILLLMDMFCQQSGLYKIVPSCYPWWENMEKMENIIHMTYDSLFIWHISPWLLAEYVQYQNVDSTDIHSPIIGSLVVPNLTSKICQAWFPGAQFANAPKSVGPNLPPNRRGAWFTRAQFA